MPVSAFVVYTKAVNNILQGRINLFSDTFVVTLLTDSYAPVSNSHETWSDVSAYELGTSGGYTAGGHTLASRTLTTETATVIFDAADPTWSSPFTAGPFRYTAIVRRAGGSLAGTDLLLCYCDLTTGGSLIGTGGAYSITLNPAGIFTATHTL